jgi:hypothetical protein
VLTKCEPGDEVANQRQKACF